MLTQHIIDMQGNIFYMQHGVVTRPAKQVIPERDARKCGFLEVPYLVD